MVDAEAEHESSSDEMDGKPEAHSNAKNPVAEPTPFLDTFYGISSPNSEERAEAVREMLRYCLIGPESNAKDASYALKRLMNGLCSGRAAARQGCASGLATFLKISLRNKMLQQIQAIEGSDAERELSVLAYVRHRLIQATTIGPSQLGRRKGSEDRDYKFGLLFGVMSIVRSGIIQPNDVDGHDERGSELDEIRSVTLTLTSDLAALFHHKQWLREPAAHAIGTLLNSLYARCPNSNAARTMGSELVEKVVIPEVLLRGAGKDAERFPLGDYVSAEHIAVALNIQAESLEKSIPLSGPLTQPILTKDFLPHLSTLLSDNSHVVQPRTHLVWDALLHYLTEPVEGSGIGVMVRRLRTKSSSNESPVDLLSTIVEHVIIRQLLRANGDGSTPTTAKSPKMTHEKGALALCLVRNLSGVEFHSSITGRTRVLVDPEIIEQCVFSPKVVLPLFFCVFTGRGAKASKSSPLLKPLSLQVLEKIVESFDSKVGDGRFDNSERRLAFVRPLLRCQPRFDAESKTNTISRLVQANAGFGYENDPSFLEQLVGFLVEQIASTIEDSSAVSVVSASVTPHNGQGYIELLFQFVKSILGSQTMECTHAIPHKVLGVLMCLAFFDSQAFKSGTMPLEHGTYTSTISESALNAAVSLKAVRSGSMSVLPYDVRSAASSRFFSSLALLVTKAMHNKDHGKVSESLMGVIRTWEGLEKGGASLLSSTWREKSFEAEVEPKKSLSRLHRRAEKISKQKANDEELQKVVSSLHALGMTLYISLLEVREVSESDHSLELETKRAALIAEFMSDTEDLCQLFLKPNDEDCTLSRLSTLCASILSSMLSEPSSSFGAYPTLLREVVKCAWLNGLAMVDKVPSQHCKDISSVLHILLDSIGCSTEDATEEESEESDSDLDSRSDSCDEASARDHQDMQMQGVDECIDTVDKDDEELDPERLQTLLEEESDAELEHHEGADAALATFIQAKKDARKAGRLAEERSIHGRQLRCTSLLEMLLVSKSKGRAALLTPESVLRLLMSFLRYRRTVEAAISHKDSGLAPSSERHDLLDRLTSILQTRLLRWRFAASQWHEDTDVAGFCSGMCVDLLQQMRRRMSMAQRSCCSLSLIAVLRAVSNTATKLEVASVYADAVTDWASKRTTGLESRMFDDLIDQEPLIAQAVLPGPLAQAAHSSARSNFLKVECLRLISRIFNENVNNNESELERLALDGVSKSMDSVMKAFAACLDNPEMKKAKRAREVLKGLERVAAFVAAAASDSHWLDGAFDEIRGKLLALKDQCDSPIVQSQCDRVMANLAGKRIPASTSGPMDHTTPSPSSGGETAGDEHRRVSRDEPNLSDSDNEKGEAPTRRKRSKKQKKRKR